jgi:hypothetical protein
MTKRREFTKPVKAEMFRRATVDGVTRCEGCGLALKAWEYDHTIAEALILDKSRKLTAEDGKLLGSCCHRGPDGKTVQDVKAIAKAKRVEARNAGIRKPKGRPMQSKGFDAKPAKSPKSALPPRRLFRPDSA